MGCWNGTCGISQLAVTHGTKVKAVVIKNNVTYPEASGFCYEGGYASPISFVIDGVYNDYGSIEYITDNKAMKLFREYFMEQLSCEKLKIDPDEHYDREMGVVNGDYSKITNEQLIDILERDRVNIKSSYFDWNSETESGRQLEAWVNIGFMMVHNDVFESVEQSLYNSSDYHLKDFNEENIKLDCTYAVEDMFQEQKLSKFDQKEMDELEKQLEDAVNASDEDAEATIRMGIKMFLRATSIWNRSWDSEVRKSGDWGNKVRIFKGGEGVDMSVFSKYHGMLKEGYIEDEKDEIVSMLSQTLVLFNMMTALRKPWMAQSGKGSQSFDTDVYTGLAKGIMKAVMNDREDLTDYELSCTQTWVQSSSRAEFEADSEYICTAVDYERDLIWIRVSEDQVTTISWNEFQKYFEY